MTRTVRRKWTEMSLSKICGEGLLWETMCSYIESRNEADVILQKAGVENIVAECAEIQDTEDFL